MNYRNLDFQELKALSDNDSKLKNLSTLEMLELMSNITNSNFEQLILLEKKKNAVSDNSKKNKLTLRQKEYISIIQSIVDAMNNRIENNLKHLQEII
jgi:hypothetical protein